VGVQKRMRGNVVHPTFNIHGTSTGRLSASDPNIQNIPRDKKLRKIFVPRAPGRTMVQVDYSQAELRVMAALSGDKHLISLFQKGSSDFFDAMIPGAFPSGSPRWRNIFSMRRRSATVTRRTTEHSLRVSFMVWRTTVRHRLSRLSLA
jgi:hypothetical protein